MCEIDLGRNWQIAHPRGCTSPTRKVGEGLFLTASQHHLLANFTTFVGVLRLILTAELTSLPKLGETGWRSAVPLPPWTRSGQP